MTTSFLTRQRLALLGVLAAVLGLTGCQHLRNLGGSCHDTKPYMKATSIAPLKIPPGFDIPDSSNALKIPALNTPAAPSPREEGPLPGRAPAV